ncbi:MAG: ATP-grasp domain-containing protein, partial [Fusobacterium sp. JB021]|nr:ATP-grasp domain-containing protein [Fusobacterium sp. JB021]
LVTAIGGPTGYGVVKCLEKIENINLVGVDSDINCPIKKQVNHFEIVPKIYENGYIEKIEKIIQRRKINVIIPTLQEELKMFSQIKNCKVITSNLACLDKSYAYEMLKEGGTKKYIPLNVKCNSKTKMLEKLKSIGFPDEDICFKPDNSHGGIGYKKITTKERYTKNIFKNKDIGVPFENFKNSITNEINLKDFTFLEYLPGEEYSVDIFNYNNFFVAVPRKRLRVSTGIVIKGEVFYDSSLIKASKEIVEKLNLNLFCNIQFKKNKYGELKLIDINPRFCGSQVMSFGAGVNFPLLCINGVLNNKLEIPNIKWGTKMIRYWECDFYK